MAYQLKPDANDLISVSQQDIKDNFQAINTLVDVNHYTFGTGASLEGKHKYLQLPQQGAAPATSATEMGLYTKDVSGSPEMFLRRQSSGVEIAFTQASQAGTGYTNLPSGIILKWGTVTVTSQPQVVNFPGAPAPAFTNIYNLQLTVIGDVGSATPNLAVTLIGGTLTTTSFSVYASLRTTQSQFNNSFYYLAIGN